MNNILLSLKRWQNTNARDSAFVRRIQTAAPPTTRWNDDRSALLAYHDHFTPGPVYWSINKEEWVFLYSITKKNRGLDLEEESQFPIARLRPRVIDPDWRILSTLDNSVGNIHTPIAIAMTSGRGNIGTSPPLVRIQIKSQTQLISVSLSRHN